MGGYNREWYEVSGCIDNELSGIAETKWSTSNCWERMKEEEEEEDNTVQFIYYILTHLNVLFMNS